MNFEERQKLKHFALEIFKKIPKGKRPIFMCVGSDKHVCDSLAPMVGELLRKQYNVSAYVYGGLDYNIDGTNIIEALNYIEVEHPDSFVVLIDATLGDSIGEVKITEGAFARFGNTLPIRKMGHISILGVVGDSCKFQLGTTKLNLVIRIAEFIAKGCAMVVSILD